MAQIAINEGLAWLKTLKKRHEELLALRNDNAHRERRFYGASADKEIVKEPVYRPRSGSPVPCRRSAAGRPAEFAVDRDGETSNAKQPKDMAMPAHQGGRLHDGEHAPLGDAGEYHECHASRVWALPQNESLGSHCARTI